MCYKIYKVHKVHKVYFKFAFHTLRNDIKYEKVESKYHVIYFYLL